MGIDENGKLLEIKLGGSKEKVDQYSVTHVVLENDSANAEINYLDGTAKNTVEDAKIKEEKEKAKKEAEEKEAAEKKAKEEEEKKHVRLHKKRKKVRNQTRNQQIQVATSEIEKGDGTDQMVNLLLRKKLEKPDCSGRKNLADIQSKSRWKTVFCYN